MSRTGKRKIKCSRGNPCGRCSRLGLRCEYSPVKPMGRPRQFREDVSPPDPIPPSPIDPQDGFPGNNFFTTDDQELLTDSVPSVPLLTTLPDPAEWAPWLEPMHFDDPISNPLESPLDPAQSDVQSIRTLSKNTTSGSEQLETCNCMDLVHKQLSAMEDFTNDLHSIKILRESTDIAEQVLRCKICFDINRKPSEVSGNPLLLGSLLSTIASCYRKVFTYQQRKATESARNASAIPLFLANNNTNNCLPLELSLTGLDYWRLLKTGFHSELDRLSRVCQSFISRQHRLHDHGHEKCREGLPCKVLGAAGHARHPADACPRSTGARASFTCFRMADHIQIEIENAQRIFASDSGSD